MSNLDDKLTWYKLKFKQLNPIHIGKKNYGVLSETRLFIPGWTMWGALVNSYGKLNGEIDETFQEGKTLFKNITCFYPEPLDGEIMFPNFKDGKLYMGNISETDFRMRYTDTYVSTAIEAPYFAAMEESLHEIEIILPGEKGNKAKELYWVGLVGIEKDREEEFKKFINQLGEIYVGGDLTYGFGKMEFIHDGNLNELLVDKNELKKWGINETGNIINDKNCFIKNYIEFKNNYELKKGSLEFIVMYDFSGDIPSIETKGYYFTPGSEININNQGKRKFTLKRGVFVEI